MTDSISAITSKFRRQALMWLIMALAMSLVWFLVSVFYKAPTLAKEQTKKQVEADELALPTMINNLNELSTLVPPIDFETVIRDLRNYPAQFKGKKFFEDNEKRWTVQVMDVANNEIVAEYLKGRSDRDKFSYFRYHNANNEQRYILIYGVMGSRQEALGAIKSVDFGLPKSVDVSVMEIKKYVNMMDNYERSEVLDVTSVVTLKETKKEIPAEAPKKDTPKEQPKPKVVEKGKKEDSEVVEGVPNFTQTQATPKPKMPPTAIPADLNEKPKESGKKSEKSEKSENKADRAEPKNDSKSAKNEPKSTPEANVADLEPAPPMTMPGDD